MNPGIRCGTHGIIPCPVGIHEVLLFRAHHSFAFWGRAGDGAFQTIQITLGRMSGKRPLAFFGRHESDFKCIIPVVKAVNGQSLTADLMGEGRRQIYIRKWILFGVKSE